ncbi:MAG: peptidoglycan DD-metalloendopeptidase family protein [Pseudomonadota bacterium]
MKILIPLLCVFLIITGCSAKKEPRFFHHSYYTVVKGDTLHSIGWRHGVTVEELVRWNGLRPPYTIFPGQQLRLNSGGTAVSSSSSGSSASSNTASKKVVPKKSTAPAVKGWRWPANGKIISKFSGSNNGIDIAAKEGSPVAAAASGEVVYAGSGLRNYGNLIIVKHNTSYFSAYAHNRKLLVKEGDKVKGGQKIAEVGDSGADRVMLHFEIRKDGSPVDPLTYLPAQ